MLWFLAALAALALGYVFARPVLMKLPAWAAFCGWVDPFIVKVFSKSRQMAVARLSGLAGVAVWLVNNFSDVPIDWTGLVQSGIEMLPTAVQQPVQRMVLPLLLWGFWGLVGKLRKMTDKPYEVVNAPADVEAAVVAHVETANAQAVATVEAAKAA